MPPKIEQDQHKNDLKTDPKIDREKGGPQAPFWSPAGPTGPSKTSKNEGGYARIEVCA